jgi:hypothetical protein
MDKQVEIRILQGVDKNFTQKISQSLDFLIDRIKFPASVKIEESLSVESNFEGHLILYIDILGLEKLSQNQVNINILSKFQEKQGKVIVIFEDIYLSQIPDYLSKAHTYFLSSPEDNPDGDGSVNKNNNTTLITVLHDIAHYIKTIHTQNKDSFSIYFGTPDIDIFNIYQNILRETIHRGHNFLPVAINPTGKQQMSDKTQLWADLKKCHLSIHMISHQALAQYPEKYGPSLEINRQVAEYCNQPGSEHLKRIIFVPAEDESTNEQFIRKIAMFKNDSSNLKNAELVQIPVEKLKNIIQSKYYDWCHPDEKKVNSFSEDQAVYFIFPPGYEEKVEPYITWFDKNNILYNRSQIGLDQLDLLRYHQEMLKTCQGVIIYYDGNEEWLSRKISDLKKSPGWGRLKPFSFKVICGEPIEKQIPEIQKDKNIKILTGKIDLDQLKNAIIA